MTKPLALIGTIGQTTKITEHTTLQGAEMAAMGRIAEAQGYRAVAAETPVSSARAAVPNGLERWDGKTPIDLVWIHQQGPNYMGGPKPQVCAHIELLTRGLATANKVFRLVVDNNQTMRHKTVYSIERRRECEAFGECARLMKEAVDNGNWTEVGIPETTDPDAGLPFLYAPITSTQLTLTKEIWDTQEEKPFDFGYVGTSRANKKKQTARLVSLGDFLLHENSNYSGSLFGKKCGFKKGWEIMSQVKAHLIVRDPGMNQTPLHRYLQALMHDAIPIVLNEPAPVAFIHSEVLQDALRVSTVEEGLALVKRRDELLPLLHEERDYWLKVDQDRCDSW